MSWFENFKKRENPGCQVSVQSRRKTHLHSKQSCIQKQKCLTESKTDYFWVTRGCQCLWNVKSEGLRRSTALYLNFILIMILHAVLLNWHITAPWLNYTNFFFTILSMKKRTTYSSTSCLPLVSFKSTNPRFVHIDEISQHFHEPQTS